MIERGASKKRELTSSASRRGLYWGFGGFAGESEAGAGVGEVDEVVGCGEKWERRERGGRFGPIYPFLVPTSALCPPSSIVLPAV